MKTQFGILIILIISQFGFGCGSKDNSAGDSSSGGGIIKTVPVKDLGIGPISKVELGDAIDESMAAKGKELFDLKCTSCHKTDKRFVGPSLAGVTERREPEWIMNMILNPEQMVAENETAKQLMMEYTAPMANQNLTEEEARSVLEYFRTLPADQNQ
ncbi:MAG: cytochrome c [Flavobacteriales bacterium]|nr:cytochrome c [Flavobacteriales bacterium]